MKGGEKVGDWAKEVKCLVVNKLNGCVLKTGDNQGKKFGVTRSEERGNKEVLGNGVDDKYKQDWQPRTPAPNVCAENSLVEKCQNGIAFWITERTALNGDRNE